MKVQHPPRGAMATVFPQPRLSVGDGVATALGALAAVVFFATMSGRDWPLIGSYRSATAALAVIGLSMCVAGGMEITQATSKGVFYRTEAFLGAVALVFVVLGLISGTQEIFVALAVTMLVLWVLTTLGHALGRS